MNELDLKSLNEQQKEAVLYNDGPLRIIAGAGSGKTRVLTHKIVYLIKELHIREDKILALTFSNKAANEMKQRALSLLNNLNYQSEYEPTISTFHSLCKNFKTWNSQYELSKRFSNYWWTRPKRST